MGGLAKEKGLTVERRFGKMFKKKFARAKHTEKSSTKETKKK